MPTIDQNQLKAILGGLQSIGQQATDLAILAERASAIAALIQGVLGLIAFIACCVVVAKNSVAFGRLLEEEDVKYITGFFAVVAAGVIGLVSLITCASDLFNAWNYIGALYPKIALAHEILYKITNR